MGRQRQSERRVSAAQGRVPDTWLGLEGRGPLCVGGANCCPGGWGWLEDHQADGNIRALLACTLSLARTLRFTQLTAPLEAEPG